MGESRNPTLVVESVYRRFRHTFEPFLAEVGIDRSVLTDPDALVPLAKHCRLLELAAEKTGENCLGIRIGMQVYPIDLGAIGYVLLNSPSVGAALDSFARYLATYSRGCFFNLERADDQHFNFDFGYTTLDIGVIDRRQEAECTLALILNIVRELTRTEWSPVRVYFEHPEPADTLEHRRVFGAPIEFGFSINRLVIKEEFLETRIRNADARLFSVIEGHLTRALASQESDTDLVNRISNLVARELSNGLPSMSLIADELALTKRTLQRRLTDHGLSFSEIVENVRRKLALQYVERSDLPFSEIAFLLGYSHPSAFSRAFKNWTDMSPHDLRHVRQAEP